MDGLVILSMEWVWKPTELQRSASTLESHPGHVRGLRLLDRNAAFQFLCDVFNVKGRWHDNRHKVSTEIGESGAGEANIRIPSAATDFDLARRPHTPAFEVVYVYSKKDGTLDLNCRGANKAVEPLQAMFAKAILGLPKLPPDTADERVYDLRTR